MEKGGSKVRVLIYISSFLFLFLSDCLAYDWIPLAFDTEDAINIAVQEEVGKKKDYDSDAFQRSAIIDAQNEVNEKNRAVDQNLIRLRNSYNREKNKRDTQKTLYDDARNRFDKEEVKYKTAIENINKSKSQKEGYKKEISLQQANLTKRLANEPVGEVVTIALYSTGWKEKKSSQEKKADILATESAIEMMMTYIDSSSIVENNILIKDMIISRKSGQAESIKQPLEQKLAAGKYLRIRNFRLYPLKKSLLRSDMDFKKQKVKAVAVLDSEVLKRFINENKIVVSDNFLKRANTLIAESRRTTAEDQKNLNNIITSQMRIISNKKINLQDVIESIKHHEGLKKISHENMNRLSTELKNEKTRLEKQAATFKKTETAYFNAKNAFTHYVFKKPRGQIKRDKAPPEIAAGILISTLHEVRDDSRRYYSDIFEQTNMGMLSVAQKGSKEVPIKITKFKITYITESAISDDMEIGAIFEVTMGKTSVKKAFGLPLMETTYSHRKKVKDQDTVVKLQDDVQKIPWGLMSLLLTTGLIVLAFCIFFVLEKLKKIPNKKTEIVLAKIFKECKKTEKEGQTKIRFYVIYFIVTVLIPTVILLLYYDRLYLLCEKIADEDWCYFAILFIYIYSFFIFLIRIPFSILINDWAGFKGNVLMEVFFFAMFPFVFVITVVVVLTFWDVVTNDFINYKFLVTKVVVVLGIVVNGLYWSCWDWFLSLQPDRT